jgi:hypothetical protein
LLALDADEGASLLKSNEGMPVLTQPGKKVDPFSKPAIQ